MSANMYDVGVPMPIMSTYVPIDFRNLYLIGAHLQEAVNKAADLLNTAILKFGEFHSPSDIDTENWYKLTLGNPVISGIINEAVSNPDALKDASWRSRLNAGLMGLDYGAMSRLKASKENMLLRLKANQELMLKGGYNPLLHDVDFANYDTLAANSGIFNDISPLPYMSTVDMVKPYVDNLKGRYLGKKNGFIFNGVADEDTDAQVNANWSSIITSPHYAQNLQLIKMQNPDISDEDAVKALNEQIFTAGREFAWNKPERDPLDLVYAKAAADKDKDDSKVKPIKTFTLTMHKDAYDKFWGNTFKDIVDKKRDPKLTKQQVSEQIMSEIQGSIGSFVQKRINQKANIYNTVDEVMDMLGTSVGPLSAKILQGMNSYEDQRLSFGNNAGDVILAVDFVRNVSGVNITSRSANGEAANTRNRLRNDIRGSMIDNYILWGSTKNVTDGYNVANVQYMYIPKDELEDYTEAEKQAVAAKLIKLNARQLATMTARTDDQGYVTTTQTEKLPGEYYKIPILAPIPMQGQLAEDLDIAHANLRESSTKVKDILAYESQDRNYNKTAEDNKDEE